MGKITVVHINSASSRTVYLGRAMSARGLQGSALGNPFKLPSEAQRGSTIARYKLWLEIMLEQRDAAVRGEMNRLYKLALAGDLELGCWCAPLPCHCDVVQAKLEAALAARGFTSDK